MLLIICTFFQDQSKIEDLGPGSFVYACKVAVSDMYIKVKAESRLFKATPFDLQKELLHVFHKVPTLSVAEAVVATDLVGQRIEIRGEISHVS